MDDIPGLSKASKAFVQKRIMVAYNERNAFRSRTESPKSSWYSRSLGQSTCSLMKHSDSFSKNVVKLLAAYVL